MYSKTNVILKFFRYYFNGSNSRGHGTHSPFVYEFITRVLNDKRPFLAYEEIENVKKRWLRDSQELNFKDLGAGTQSTSRKTVSSIARTSVSSKKFGRLLFRIANFYKPVRIIELGTSLGISTAYLSKGAVGSEMISLEGSTEVASKAGQTFKVLGLDHVQIITGNFDQQLPGVIEKYPAFDLIFIDGNHKKKPVIEYFEMFLKKIPSSALIIIHDIHWSEDMENAWTYIKSRPEIMMTIDIFSAGLVFFRDEFKVKQDFTIRF